jgi:hypothetical protein
MMASGYIYDPAKDEVILLGGERRQVKSLVASLIGGADYLPQRRLSPHRQLKTLFGPRLWSLRVLVLLAVGEPVVHYARRHNQPSPGARIPNPWRATHRPWIVDTFANPRMG